MQILKEILYTLSASMQLLKKICTDRNIFGWMWQLRINEWRAGGYTFLLSDNVTCFIPQCLSAPLSVYHQYNTVLLSLLPAVHTRNVHCNVETNWIAVHCTFFYCVYTDITLISDNIGEWLALFWSFRVWGLLCTSRPLLMSAAWIMTFLMLFVTSPKITSFPDSHLHPRIKLITLTRSRTNTGLERVP